MAGQIKFPQRPQPLPPPGMEWVKNPDGSMGFKEKGGGSTKSTEHERMLERLKTDPVAADSIRAGLKLSARDAAIDGRAAGGAGALSQIVRRPAVPGEPDSLAIKVGTTGALKTLRELDEAVDTKSFREAAARTEVDIARNERFNKREDRMRGILVEINKILNSATVDPESDIQVERVAGLRKLYNLEKSELQRLQGTEGIETSGGPEELGSKENHYLTSTDIEIRFLPIGAKYKDSEDPTGTIRTRGGNEIKKGIDPAIIEAERQRYMKAHPNPEHQKRVPPVKPKVIKAGGLSERPKPSKPGKPPLTEEKIRRFIDQINKNLTTSGKVKGRARVKMINRLETLKRELEELTK